MCAAATFDINEHRITQPTAAVYTPMKPSGLELDLEKIPAYAERLASIGVTSILSAGTNGESLSLSVTERKRLAEAWAQEGPPRGIRVYVHVGAESLADAVELATHAAGTAGVSGMVCMTPIFFKPTTRSLHDFLAVVAAAAPQLPFWYYHFPSTSGVLPGKAHSLLEMIDNSGKIPNFTGIKFTDYDLMDFQLCMQVGGERKYNMLYGRDEQVLPALQLGADSFVSSTVQYSSTLRKVDSLFRHGNEPGAKAAQLQNARLCAMLGEYAPDVNVQKGIMRMTGLDVGPSRLPKRDLSPSEYSALHGELVSQDLIDGVGTCSG
mmetsp:Transcript_107610/g.321826  ORF Transcript_107610/g.321826 Transcript_107610/m.321826 type:complete len:322 (-) Transcript_107610:47-1012(-)